MARVQKLQKRVLMDYSGITEIAFGSQHLGSWRVLWGSTIRWKML